MTLSVCTDTASWSLWPLTLWSIKLDWLCSMRWCKAFVWFLKACCESCSSIVKGKKKPSYYHLLQEPSLSFFMQQDPVLGSHIFSRIVSHVNQTACHCSPEEILDSLEEGRWSSPVHAFEAYGGILTGWQGDDMTADMPGHLFLPISRSSKVLISTTRLTRKSGIKPPPFTIRDPFTNHFTIHMPKDFHEMIWTAYLMEWNGSGRYWLIYELYANLTFQRKSFWHWEFLPKTIHCEFLFQKSDCPFQTLI